MPSDKSNLSLILDKYNFKSYINTIGREELLGARPSSDKVGDLNLLNTRLGAVSDVLFSVSNSPMYTYEFLNEFSDIKDAGEFLQVTFENEGRNVNTLNSDRIIDNSNIQIDNIKKNTFRSALREVVNGDSRNTALRHNLQGRAPLKDLQGQAKAFSIKETLLIKNDSAEINKNPLERPTKKDPHLATYQIFNDALAIGNRQTSELAAFFNLIPTLEFSRAVPIIAAKFSLPAKTFKSRSNIGNQFSVANNADFLFGSESQSAKETMTAYKGDAFTKTITNKRGLSADIAGISTNLDIFLSPQTMVNTEEKYAGAEGDFDGASRARFRNNGKGTAVIDKMRPFMSIESFEIDVKPTRGLLSYKTAQLDLVLHDRSRMSDIAPFIKPDLFGVFGAEISVEYGWAHPDGTNPYGAMLNLMRAREKYMVVNSSFNLQETGEVKITLYLAMLGATDILNSNFFVGENIQIQIKQFEEAREAFKSRTESFSEEFKDTSTLNSVLSSASSIANNANFSDEYILSLEKFINPLNEVNEQKADDLLRDDARRLLERIKKLNTTKESTANNLLSIINSSEYDPYLSYTIMKKMKLIDNAGKIIDRTNKNGELSDYVSFGKVLLTFLGKNLASSKRFNEVQLIFYNTNSKCGYASSVNIANIPIKKSELRKYILETITKNIDSISLGNLILSINKRFIQNKSSIAYGFQGIYTYDSKTNSIKTPTGVTQNEAVASQKEILYKAYYGEEQFKLLKDALKPGTEVKPGSNHEKALLRKVDFIIPRLGFSTEVIYKSDSQSRINELNISPEPVFSYSSSNSDDDTILRIHIFDKANTPFQGAYDFINDSFDSDRTTLNNSLIVQRNDLIGSPTAASLKTFNESINKELSALKVNVDDGEGERTNVNIFTKFGAIKEAYKKIMPTLTYGSQNSAIINASFQTINEGRLSTLFITRADRALDTGQTSDTQTIRIGANDLPLRVLPSKVDLTTFGCPIINFAQSLFFDFGTGTTVDNMYNVTGIKHRISQGKFESGLTLQYGDIYGKFESRIVSRLEYDNVIKKLRDNERRLINRAREDEEARAADVRSRIPRGDQDFIYVDLFEI